MLYGTDSTMEKTVTADLGSQDNNDGGANRSILVATTILHPMVQDLAYAASNKAQNRVLKQAAALKRDADTKFRWVWRQDSWLGGVLLLVAWDYLALIMGHVILGVGIGIASLTTPVYIARVALPPMWGRSVTMGSKGSIQDLRETKEEGLKELQEISGSVPQPPQ
jgi:hypothetical protein